MDLSWIKQLTVHTQWATASPVRYMRNEGQAEEKVGCMSEACGQPLMESTAMGDGGVDWRGRGGDGGGGVGVGEWREREREKGWGGGGVTNGG